MLGCEYLWSVGWDCDGMEEVRGSNPLSSTELHRRLPKLIPQALGPGPEGDSRRIDRVDAYARPRHRAGRADPSAILGSDGGLSLVRASRTHG
jgi:hypothetical protein